MGKELATKSVISDSSNGSYCFVHCWKPNTPPGWFHRWRGGVHRTTSHVRKVLCMKWQVKVTGGVGDGRILGSDVQSSSD